MTVKDLEWLIITDNLKPHRWYAFTGYLRNRWGFAFLVWGIGQITRKTGALAGSPPPKLPGHSRGCEMTKEEIKEVVKMSGMELLSTDQLGNPFEMSEDDIALMFFTMARGDISLQDKALILAGILVAPMEG